MKRDVDTQPLSIIRPDWPAPANVIAGVTTRKGGVSQQNFNSLNLAEHVGDEPSAVAQNRALLNKHCINEYNGRKTKDSQPALLHWHWLDQTHSSKVIHLAEPPKRQKADACWTQQKNVVCSILTADCLPILICDRQGSTVAAIHAGWRGLAAGIVQNTIDALCAQHKTFNFSPQQLCAWMGPAIGPNCFQVGSEVKELFCRAKYPQANNTAFVPNDGQNGKYVADIYRLASIALHHSGISDISGGDYCTVTDADNFFSYRRDGITGRIASFIYIAG